jgi:hypothetical protein
LKNFTISNNLKNQLIYNIVDFLEKVSKVEDGKLYIPFPEQNDFYDEDCPIYTSFFTKDKGKKTKWTLHYGATKIVFVPNRYNFVIKIPLNCGGEFLYDGDNIAGCYVDRILYPYERADSEGNWDYCKVEEKLYRKAKENKVEKFFAGTYFFKNIKVNEEIYPIYISEKVEQNNGILYDTYHSNEEECNKMYRHYKANTKYECWGVSDEALLLLSKKYRESEIWRLLEFIRNFGITDLTNRNCGFTSDGRLVILDYSGYNEIDDYYDDEDWEEEDWEEE